MNMPLSRQSGATLLILMLVMMTVFATLLVSSLRGRNPEDTRREQSAAAIEQARQALIAWSLSRDGTNGSAVLNPAELPCPANPNESNVTQVGMSRSLGCDETAATYRIGLLPWKTLGIPKIVDGYGEPLWYSVDLGFVAREGGNPDRKVNSDSFATLQVYAANGVQNYSTNGEGAAAVIFAAGPPIAGQVRSAPFAVSQYLEGAAGRNNSTVGGPFIAGTLSFTFNDQLGVVTGRALIDGAQARLGSEIAAQLVQYDLAVKATTPISSGTGSGTPCAKAWVKKSKYSKNEQVSSGGHNWIAKKDIKKSNAKPRSNKSWLDAGTCGVVVPPALPLTAAPYPADLVGDSSCQDNDLDVSNCADELDQCTGILPRTSESYTGEGLMTEPTTNNLPQWFQQNIWHRAVFYAVKQGLVCTNNFTLDGVLDPTINALFILPGASKTTQRANNLAVATLETASTDLKLYLEDVENQDAWLPSNNHKYVRPSCAGKNAMYIFRAGLCSKECSDSGVIRTSKC